VRGATGADVLHLSSLDLRWPGTGSGTPAATGPSTAPARTPATPAGTPAPPDPGPLAAATLFVQTGGPAAEQVQAWQGAGRTRDAAAIRRIADQPTAVWITNDARGFAARAADVVRQAAAADDLPVLVANFLPDRGCDDTHAGAPDAGRYRVWVDALVDAIGDRPALVILEPGAVAQTVSGCVDDEEAVDERYELLSAAVDAFTGGPRTRVYLDAGNPAWITDTDALATGLRRAGIARTGGFALNVANFETTAANVEYGRRLSDRLDGAHFVVDTSRNGNGPFGEYSGDRHWCNPPGRALGDPPTTRTGQPRVDAYLWVKRPGESDGSCGDGAPAAGAWWPEYALSLARG
jgi:endoglucanase